MLHNGTATNKEDQGDSDEGYEDLAGDDYNLDSAATNFSTAISIPTSA